MSPSNGALIGHSGPWKKGFLGDGFEPGDVREVDASCCALWPEGSLRRILVGLSFEEPVVSALDLELLASLRNLGPIRADVLNLSPRQDWHHRSRLHAGYVFGEVGAS